VPSGRKGVFRGKLVDGAGAFPTFRERKPSALAKRDKKNGFFVAVDAANEAADFNRSRRSDVPGELH
jgi:hypothetical protein